MRHIFCDHFIGRKSEKLFVAPAAVVDVVGVDVVVVVAVVVVVVAIVTVLVSEEN